MTSQESELSETYFEGLLKHREAMVALRSDQLTTLDKSLLGVSSGAFGISIAFADKIGGGVTNYLLLAWLCFAAAISANIISYFTGGEDAAREIKKIDQCIITATRYESGGNPFRGATQALNIIALVLFVTGVLSLTLHAYTSTRPAIHGTTAAASSPKPDPISEGDTKPATTTSNP